MSGNDELQDLDSSIQRPGSARYRDSRELTCEVIYERSRRKKLEGSTRTFLIFLLSVILSIGAIVSISLLQYDEYFAYMNDRNDYIDASQIYCKKISIADIDIMSTAIAGVLILLYIFMYKRRVFLKDRFKYRNIGIPMMISMWNKSDRFYSAITYGTIAFNVFNIVRNSFKSTSTSIIPFKDPSGVLPLLVKIMQVFLIGIRYYPVLVAYRANSFVICLLTACYMWIDFISNIYEYGKCESISSQTGDGKEETKRRLWYFMTYKVLSSIPLCIFSAFIVINLTYKGSILLFDYLYRKTYFKYKKRNNFGKDSFCCKVFNVDDENEFLYSKYDILYVYNLLHSNDVKEQHEGSNDEAKKTPEVLEFQREKKLQKTLNKFKVALNLQEESTLTLYYCELKEIKKENFLQRIFGKFIYKWDETFRFSSRFINSMVVALVALYYVWLFWSYFVLTIITAVSESIPEEFDVSSGTINLGKIACAISEFTCVPALEEMGDLPIPLPKKVINFLPSARSSLNAIFIVPLFGALLICLLQLFLFAKDCKTHLMQMYKGECEYVVKAKNLANHSIAASSFHFGGYLVAYLIWGYFILYAFWTILGIIIMGIRLFIGDGTFGQIALKLVPVITVIIFKTSVNLIASRFAFTLRHTKMLALNNFRAFNIFLYFNFYYDCFMGIISAVIRLIKSVLAAIFYMPRISYSFFGRHLERMDNGYGCYSGFLHMESMHTNPIIISFCSLLYYKDLSEFIRRHHVEKKLKSQNYPGYELQLATFDGMLPLTDPPIVHPYLKKMNIDPESPRKRYNQFIRNKWHVFAMLAKNRDLVKYRKANWIKIEEKPKPSSFLSKVTSMCAPCIRTAKTSDSSHRNSKDIPTFQNQIFSKSDEIDETRAEPQMAINQPRYNSAENENPQYQDVHF